MWGFCRGVCGLFVRFELEVLDVCFGVMFVFGALFDILISLCGVIVLFSEFRCYFSLLRVKCGFGCVGSGCSCCFLV